MIMTRILLKKYAVLTLICFTVLCGQVQVASGTGYGLTKDAATEQAKRDAVEQGLGAYMTSSTCLLYTSPSPRDQRGSRMPSSA